MLSHTRFDAIIRMRVQHFLEVTNKKRQDGQPAFFCCLKSGEKQVSLDFILGSIGFQSGSKLLTYKNTTRKKCGKTE